MLKRVLGVVLEMSLCEDLVILELLSVRLELAGGDVFDARSIFKLMDSLISFVILLMPF